MNRPALATASTVLGLMLLLGGKAATSPDPLTLPGTSHVALAPTGHGAAKGALTNAVTGPVSNTPYGPVQVRIIVKGGQLTDIQALALPTGGTSGSIADYAVPILRSEALTAQGAGIHAVSGATYTSQGYVSSLQAALDQLASQPAQPGAQAAPTAQGGST